VLLIQECSDNTIIWVFSNPAISKSDAIISHYPDNNSGSEFRLSMGGMLDDITKRSIAVCSREEIWKQGEISEDETVVCLESKPILHL